MKTAKIVFGILSITFGLLTESHGQGPTNLLVNTNFGANGYANHVPNGWTFYEESWVGSVHDYWCDYANGGGYCGTYYWKQWFPSEASNNVSGIFQVDGSAPGSVYQAGGWYETYSGDAFGADCFTWVQVTFLDSGNNALAVYKSDNFNITYGENQWVYLPVTNACDVTQPVSLNDPYFTNYYAVTGSVSQILAPVGTTLVRYDYSYFEHQGEGGSCYFDCAALNQVGFQPPTPPNITSQPQSVVVDAHDNASFSVEASGTPPLSYQWLFDGSNIAGATSSTLTVPHVAQTNLGTYAVVATNEFGSDTSSNATLSMYPFIESPFTGAITYWGSNATFSVSAWGTGPLSYQWLDNGVPIQNATNETFTLTNIQFTNAGLYTVVVSSALGSVTNTPEQVIVEPAGVSLGFSPTLTISGVTGYNYIIQSSTNLANTNAWVTLTNLTLTQAVQLWVDTNVDASSPFNPTYFYRVLPGQ